MKIDKRLSSLILALAVAGVVSASPPKKQPVPMFDFPSVDANKDGKVSPEEVQYIDDLRASFPALDINHDDALSESEFSRWNRASKTMPADPSTAPGGSAGAQHMPRSK